LIDNKSKLSDNLYMNHPEGVALIVVDPLRRFTVEGAPFEVEGASIILTEINVLAERFRINSLPVMWVSRLIRPQLSLGTRTASKYKGMSAAFLGEWAEMDHRLDVQPEDYVIFKPRHSAFYATDLEIILRENKVSEIWICGFTFNVCILATAFDAVARDIKVKFLIDQCGVLPAKIKEKLIAADSVHEYTKIVADYAVGEMLDTSEAHKFLSNNSVR
jgi:nicotinamidase-related amidase